MNTAHRAVRTSALRAVAGRRPQFGLHAVILALLLITLAPPYLMLIWSFKNPFQFLDDRWLLSFPLRVGNYGAAWEIVQRYIFNTIFVAVLGFLGMVTLSVIGGYAFARMRFPFREPLYYALLSVLMVPWVLSFIPQYMLYYDLGLVNTRWALIMPIIAHGQVLGIFLTRSFFTGIPEELYEAARCDGAGIWTLIWRITVPLSLPILAVLAVLTFLNAWNSFIWPLVAITDTKLQVISVGLYAISESQGGGGGQPALQSYDQYGPLFAGYTIACLPLAVLFLALGRFYVEGLVESGLKV